MFTRSITPFFFAIALALSVNGVASAAPLASDTASVTKIPPNSRPFLTDVLKPLLFEPTIPGVSKVAQVYYASACYTSAGACPMRVFVLQGAPCVCYTPTGAWSGQAW